MGMREPTGTGPRERVFDLVRALNARHPWSHNDHFHNWIRTRLPIQRHTALDIGCGRGELLAQLANSFDQARGTDIDTEMRAAAAARCAGLPNVEVIDTDIADMEGPFDVVTMVAVLHHLELEPALDLVRRLLAPGGRFLCVGLARPVTMTDRLWYAASSVTNPVIGWVKHPWPSADGPQEPPFPIADPRSGFDEIRSCARTVLPGVRMKRRLGFRYTLEWTKPA